MWLKRFFGRQNQQLRSASITQTSGRRPSARHLQVEPLEERRLLTVSFNAGPFAAPANQPDVGVGTFGGWTPVEPTIVVSPADPGNVAVSSHGGLRLSNNAGGTFSATTAFVDPVGTTSTKGDTDLIFDSQGRLFWSNLSGIGADGV